jgi:hypothetical protein
MGVQRGSMSLSVESGQHEEQSRPTSTFISNLDRIPTPSEKDDSTPLRAKGEDEKMAGRSSMGVETQQDHDLDDWENDPDNARNWSLGRKWVAVGIVRSLISLGDL